MPIRDHYPESNILSQRGHWDEATRRIVLDRVHNVPSFRHFSEHQKAVLRALCGRVISQDWKPPERRVPIAPWIDACVTESTLEGFRFDDMPSNEQAWEWGLAGLDETAQALFHQPFAGIDATNQDRVLETIRGGNPPGEAWQRMPAKRWWIFVALRQILGIYYAHPYAWDEIGFGGPAYPRGYIALNGGMPEPWEARETTEDGRRIKNE